MSLTSIPYDHYTDMRKKNPIYFNKAMNAWEIYKYEDIQHVLLNPNIFSSDVSVNQTIATMDPPRHTQLRRLVSKAFTMKTVLDLTPKVENIVEELLLGLKNVTSFNVVSDYAFQLPVRVIAELLGLPASDREQFKKWAISAVNAVVFEYLQQPIPAQLARDVVDLEKYLLDAANERKAIPRNDLISGLVNAEVDGERLLDQEIVSTCRLLLVAGFETSTNLIGNTVYLLLTNPQYIKNCIEDENFIDLCIEESLRMFMPFQFFARKITQSTQLKGFDMEPGQYALIFNASGNRDESVFERSNEFYPDRPAIKHLSFGHGIHYCLGAALGRMETKVAIQKLLKAYPTLGLSSEHEIKRLDSPVLFGFSALHVTTG